MNQIGKYWVVKSLPLPTLRAVTRRCQASFRATKQRHPEWTFDDASFDIILRPAKFNDDIYDRFPTYGWKANVLANTLDTQTDLGSPGRI